MNDFEDPIDQRPIDRRAAVKAGLAAAGAVVLAGCASDDGDDGSADASGETGETLTVRISSFESTSVPYNFGLDLGLFDDVLAEYNIELEVTNFANGSAAVQAAQAGELDILTSGDQMLTTAQVENDLPFKIIAVNYTNRKWEYLARLDSGITEPADVKGHKLGVEVGANPYLAILAFLEENGLTKDDVEINNLSKADQVTAFQTGDIDWGVFNGNNRDVLNEYGATFLGYNGDYKANICAIAVSDEFAAEHHDVIVALIKAFDTASEYANEHTDEVIESTLLHYDSDEDSVRTYIEDCDFTIDLDAEALEILQQTLDYSLVAELISTETDIADLVDTSYQIEAGIIEG